MDLNGKKILIGITGGIAAYKIVDLVSLLIKQGANVKVMMTKNATNFITPLTLQTISKNKVILDTFDQENADEVEHIKLAQSSDLIVIAPASANMIAKAANGIADDIVSTVLIATNKPVLFVPAMNTVMYQNKVTQDNLDRLHELGYSIMSPTTGMLACGVEGVGKLPDVKDIMDRIESELTPKSFLGKTVIVTAGGTKEYIDPVRFITNKSSGKMGYEIAKEFDRQGAMVTLITSGEVPIKGNMKVVKVESADDMYNAIKDKYAIADIVIMSAAVADYKTKNISDKKIKKTEDEKDMTLELTENMDILKTLGSQKNKQFLVGFAAETNDLIENAQKKLIKKNADMIIANDVSVTGAGFEVDTNIIKILRKDKDIIEFPLMPKKQIANTIAGLIYIEMGLGSICKMKAE